VEPNSPRIHGKSRIDPDLLSLLVQKVKPRGDLRLKVVSNLPYCIATPAIMNLLESDLPWERMVVMVQEEVAERFLAAPGESAFGQATVLAQSMAEIRSVRRVGAQAFWPKPAVDSRILMLEPKAHGFSRGNPISYPQFKAFTRAIFANKRKTWLKSLRISLKSIDIDEKIFAGHLKKTPTDMRAQDIPIEDIMSLAILYYTRVSPP